MLQKKPRQGRNPGPLHRRLAAFSVRQAPVAGLPRASELSGPDEHGRIRAIEASLYAEWKRYGPHLEEYASEFVQTVALLFCVVGVVAYLFGATSPLVRLLPSVSLRLFLTGLLLGGASWLLALSPPGRLSGAHLNPAVSLGFWLLDKMHRRDLAGYIGGQLLGAVVGTRIGVAVFGRLAREVHNATLRPGPSVGPIWAFLGEVGATFVLTVLIYTFLSHASLQRWTPAMVMIMVGLLVGVDGNVSGAGMNPVRWFGPATSVATWHFVWVYTAGPTAGSVAAALVRRSRLCRQHRPHSAKFVHDAGYRSIFKHDTVPSTPPPSVRQGATS